MGGLFKSTVRFSCLTLSLCCLVGCSSAELDLQDDWQHARQTGFNDFRNNNLDASVRHYEGAVALARQLKKADQLAATLNDLGRVLLAQSNFPRAAQVFGEALAAIDLAGASAPEYAPVRCEALAGLARAHHKMDHAQDAERWYAQALDVARQHKQGQQLRDVTFEYAAFLKGRGEVERAAALENATAEARSAAEPLPQPEDQHRYEAEQHLALGQKALRADDTVKAHAEFQLALKSALQLKDKSPAGNCYTQLGATALRRKNYPIAQTCFLQGLQAFRQANAGAVCRRAAISGLTVALTGLHSFEKAEACAHQLIADSEIIDSKDGHEQREAWLALADVYRTSGRNRQALDPMSKIYDNARVFAPLSSAECTMDMCYLANQHWLLGETVGADKLINEYVAGVCKEKAEKLPHAARLLNDYAQALIASRQPEEAALFATGARKITAHAQHR